MLDMKRYFSISLTLFFFSVLNVLTYFLLGLTTGDPTFSGVFSIAYPLQFIVSILMYFFCTASNIRGNKEKNKDCVYTGMIMGIIFATIIFGIVAIFISDYISFMNMDASKYRIFSLMAVGQLFFHYINNLVSEKLYFENKDKLANLSSIGFILLNLLTVVIPSIFTKNQVIILIINLSSLFVYVVVWLGFNFKKFKFNFSIIKNLRFESINILGSVLMLLIYLFGFRISFGFGEEYYLALTFINLITDPLWDAVSAIGKITKIDISQSNYNYKKTLKNSAVISFFYIFIGIVLFFSLLNLYGIVFKIGLIYLCFQIADLIANIFRASLRIFLQIEYSAVKSTSIVLFYRGLRVLLSSFLLTPYNNDIAQVSCEAIGFISILIIRFRNYKLDKDGNLIRKNLKTSINNNDNANQIEKI